MSSNAFNRPHVHAKPPSYCYSHHTCLPPLDPPEGPALLHAFARWTDLDPSAPIDIAVYCPIHRVDGGSNWYGQVVKGAVRFEIELTRLADPQPWTLLLTVWDPWRTPEIMPWTPIQIQLDPSFDTGLLQQVTVPGLDFKLARVQQ